MSFFQELFGDNLETKSGQKPTSEVLKGKGHVLVYFSAHWCPPCRKFTPAFAQFHKNFNSAKNFETVFVSLDRDEASFKEYYDSMPWTAIPYASANREVVSSKYGGEGIPELVVFDAEGKIVRRGAVENVMMDSSAVAFPWAPPKWEDAMPEKFIKQDGTTVGKEALNGKTVGIYCSAHWCPPCRSFTPKLASFYDAYKKLDPNFEIVFCSSDKSEKEMMSYFKEAHGDYLCYEYGSKQRETMKKMVDASGIPTFAIYKGGKLVNKEGRSKVGMGADAVAAEGWEPPFVGDLSQTAEVRGVDINRAPAVVLRMEGCDDDTVKDGEKALEAVAKEFAMKSAEPDVIFFVSKSMGGITKQLSQMCKKNGGPRCAVPDDEPLMMLFNIPDNGAFYESPTTDITPDSVRAFIKEFNDGKLSRKQLQQ